MNIGILGTGRVAQTLGRHWVAAGHDVTFGSRDPSSKDASAAPVEGLAATVMGNEVVVDATPGSASLELVEGSDRRAQMTAWARP
jgi:hypothetical protein